MTHKKYVSLISECGCALSGAHYSWLNRVWFRFAGGAEGAHDPSEGRWRWVLLPFSLPVSLLWEGLEHGNCRSVCGDQIQELSDWDWGNKILGCVLGCSCRMLLCFVFVSWSTVGSGNAWLQPPGCSFSFLPTAPTITQVCPKLLPAGSSALLWVLLPGCFGRDHLSLNVGFRRAFLSLIELGDF